MTTVLKETRLPITRKMEGEQTLATSRVVAEAPTEVVQPPRTKTRQRFGKRVIAIPVILAAVIAGGVYGHSYLTWAFGHETTDDAFIDGHIIQVSPRVAGHVAKVYVDDNQFVKAGDLLFELDARDYEAALASANGKFSAAQADLAAAKSALEEAQAKLDATRAGVEQFQATAISKLAESERAHADLSQYSQAQKNGVVTGVEWNKVQTDAKTADAAYEAAQKSVTAVSAMVIQSQATVKTAEGRIAQAEAQIATAQAAVDAAKLNLSYTKVFAAEDGRVTRKNVEPGNFINPGTPVMALVGPDVWVTANFKETQLAQMKPGQKVEIKVDAYPRTKFVGHVDSIQQGAGARFSLLPPENATGNYVKVVQRVPVKIVFDTQPDAAHLLGPGMSVEPAVAIR